MAFPGSSFSYVQSPTFILFLRLCVILLLRYPYHRCDPEPVEVFRESFWKCSNPVYSSIMKPHEYINLPEVDVCSLYILYKRFNPVVKH